MRKTSRSRSIVLVHPILLLTALSVRAAETGDFDGDGRLSIRDAFERFLDLPSAPGSLDGFDAYPCPSGERAQAGAVQIEALRRAFPDSLPNWFHGWPAEADGFSQAPLPETEVVSFEMLESVATGGAEDEFELEIVVTTRVPLHAFWLVLETDGDDDVLRVPFSSSKSASRFESCCDHLLGQSELFVEVALGTFLITNGRFVITHGFPSGRRGLDGSIWEEPLPPGTYSMGTIGRLKRGTARGDYALRIHPSSEVLLEDGTIASPTSVGAGTIHVISDVTGGYDGGIPPLRFDRASGSVLGPIEFRVTDAEGLPGETVQIRVQMRTEVPLSDIYLHIPIRPGGLLTCDGYFTNVFMDRERGTLYGPTDVGTCWDFNGGIAPYLKLGYGFPLETHREHSLEYFRPLGEWVDLAVADLTIDACAPGGTEIDLEILRYNPDASLTEHGLVRTPPSFHPYVPTFGCGHENQPGHPNWSHEYILHAGKITVLGDEPKCGPPPDIGLRVVLGEASGAPGDVVEVPVLASADTDVSHLTLALEIDPAAVEVESAAMDVLNRRTLETVTIHTSRGSRELFEDCDDGPNGFECISGVPFALTYHDTDSRRVVLDQIVHVGESALEVSYLGEEFREVMRLSIRIRDDFTGSETAIRAAFDVSVPEFGRDDIETGAFLLWPDLDVFAPARSVEEGIVRIGGAGFVRGDANGDEESNLSDAVFTLNYLFLGGPSPDCEDAADSDDSGRLELTDAVFLLNALFLGTGPLPEPHPGCGGDPTGDVLECAARGCP